MYGIGDCVLNTLVLLLLQEVMYLDGLMHRKRGASPEVVCEKYQDAITVHFRAIKGLPVGFPYYQNLNPELLLRIIGDLLEYAPQQVSAV